MFEMIRIISGAHESDIEKKIERKNYLASRDYIHVSGDNFIRLIPLTLKAVQQDEAIYAMSHGK